MKKLLAVSTAAVAVTTGVTATADAATHTVKSGDTLGSISQQYGTSVSAIKAENGLKSNLIFPNQVIKVNEKSSESTTEYTVVAGDTLGKIAAKYDVTVSQLKAWNNLSSDLIIVGQTLSLQAPAQSAEPAKAPVAQQAPVQQTQEQVAAPAQQQSYQAPVQSYQAPAQQTYQAPAQQTYKAPAQQSYQAPAQKVRTTQTSTASTGGSTKAQFLAAGGSEAMWNAIVLPESSGNPNAVNPAGYRGLGQTKEAWGQGSVATQTKGMLNYAKNRYGSESAAIAFRQAKGWW
ncbi:MULTISPECIES: LysM peptidoglycan-binding domain-containing protein [unclassified Mammaliicoccus]|uniref:aggregation-promoting factor C-terminal-like domain-containing protein n=1 Tax=unclassified Mammaliicoccus TaxID=2803851 RepID=UPI001EFC1910|nr:MULTISPECIES: LysM peptidoglycan-binding domain-containing protein [unclassified Mammaliicoccus]